MVITVGDMIRSQLRLILRNGADTYDIENQQYTDAMQANNMMLDEWSAQRLMIRSLIGQDFTLTANKATYTIGTGMDINTAKPIAISSAFVRDTAGIDSPLTIIHSIEEYDAIGDKSFTTGIPTKLYFYEGVSQQASPQSGIIELDTMPDQAYTVHLEQQKYLTEFTTVTTTITFEPAYLKAIKFNGALEYYYEYHPPNAVLPPWLVHTAEKSLSIIKGMNAETPVARFDFPGSKGRWNYLSDSYS